jgi:DNA-binding CsgD family transcriptional regulator
VKKAPSFSILNGAGALMLVTSVAVPGTAQGPRDPSPALVAPPSVFQAAGPTPASIQSAVDAYRAALGAVNNGNNPGSPAGGRREINWDGGGNNNTTSAPVTPFDVFLNTRGARFTTRGTGLSQAPPSGGLTPRVAETLLWLTQGKTNGEIATILGNSESTVKKHVLEIFVKLGVET